MAAIPTRATVKVSIKAQRNGTADYDGGMTADEVIDILFPDGTGIGQINRVAQGDAVVVNSGGPVQLDLQTLVVPVDGTLGLTAARLVQFRAGAANTGALVVSFADANGWDNLVNSTGTITLQAGASALFILPVGYLVDASTKIVDVTTGEATDQTLSFVVLGVGP